MGGLLNPYTFHTIYDYAVETAFDGGKVEGKTEVAAKMKQKGFAAKDISEMTGLSKDDIEKL